MPEALNQRKGQVMQHLVQMKITPQARPASDEEGLNFANNLIYPTLRNGVSNYSRKAKSWLAVLSVAPSVWHSW
jgi:hypothetical protein